MSPRGSDPQPFESMAGRTTDSQRSASAEHIIWGSVENSSTDTSGGTSDRRSFAERELMKRSIIAAKGIVVRNDSPSHSRSFSAEPVAKCKEEVAKRKDESGSALSAAHVLETPPEPLPSLEETPPGPVPSLGSAGHVTGSCKPCLLLFKGVRCTAGAECSFCHYPHDRKSVAREHAKQSKGKRDRFMKLCARMEAMEKAAGEGGAAGGASADRESKMSL